jgi:hypothetical protein
MACSAHVRALVDRALLPARERGVGSWWFDAESSKWSAASLPDAPPAQGRCSRLVIVSWNCWMEDHFRPFRLPMVVDTLLRCADGRAPDVIALHETTPELLRLLLEEPLVRAEYFTSHASVSSVSPFATVLLWKRGLGPHALGVHALPSKMRQHLLTLELFQGCKEHVVVGASQFELSGSAPCAWRVRQSKHVADVFGSAGAAACVLACDIVTRDTCADESTVVENLFAVGLVDRGGSPTVPSWRGNQAYRPDRIFLRSNDTWADSHRWQCGDAPVEHPRCKGCRGEGGRVQTPAEHFGVCVELRRHEGPSSSRARATSIPPRAVEEGSPPVACSPPPSTSGPEGGSGEEDPHTSCRGGL